MAHNTNTHQESKTASQGEVAMRAFFKIADLWQLKPDEAMRLLGQPPRSTFYQWRKGQVGQLAHDSLIRISLLLGIFKALEILFPAAEQADAWIRKPNLAFGGQSALERMLAGNMMDIAYVRQYVDGVRGGGL